MFKDCAPQGLALQRLLNYLSPRYFGSDQAMQAVNVAVPGLEGREDCFQAYVA
jgi:hypothetical protein